MESITPEPTTDAEEYARLPRQQRILVAAQAIAEASPLSQVQALRQLAAVYQRAARHALSADLAAYLRANADTARQLANAAEEAPQP